MAAVAPNDSTRDTKKKPSICCRPHPQPIHVTRPKREGSTSPKLEQHHTPPAPQKHPTSYKCNFETGGKSRHKPTHRVKRCSMTQTNKNEKYHLPSLFAAATTSERVTAHTIGPDRQLRRESGGPRMGYLLKGGEVIPPAGRAPPRHKDYEEHTSPGNSAASRQ